MGFLVFGTPCAASDQHCRHLCDSGGSVPHGSLVISPYVLSSKHLGTQASVWRWSARYQPRGSEWDAASQDFQTLEDSFGMQRDEVEHLLRQLEESVSRANDELDREIQCTRQRIVEQKRAIEREKVERGRRLEADRRNSGSSSYSSGSM